MEVTYCNSVEETLKDKDIVFIMTEWDEFKNMDVQLFKKLMKIPLVYDGRNCFKTSIIKENGIEYYSIGRK